MSNYIYEEHIIIPKYSGSITLTSGSASKMYNGSALSNHTVTQSNLVITDLNTNTQASNPKFTADYGSWPSIIDENTSVQNSFVASNKRWYINNTEDITQYIAAEDEHITKKFGTLSITDNPTYPNIGGGTFNLYSGNSVTMFGFVYASQDQGSVTPNTISINGHTHIFGSPNLENGIHNFAYDNSSQQYEFYIHKNTYNTILPNCKIYVRRTDTNVVQIINYNSASSVAYFFETKANDILGFKNVHTNIPLEIYFIPA